MPSIEDTPSGATPLPSSVIRDVDIVQRGAAIVRESAANWQLPGIEDSTPESLGISGEAAEKLKNGGFTNAEMEKLRAHGVDVSTPTPAHTGKVR